jgi:hypothetical protein
VERRAMSFTAPIPEDMQGLMDGLALLGGILD